MKLLSLIVAASFAISAVAGKVIELDERLKDEKLYKHGGSWVVMFYAPWCAYCQKMEPAWERVAKHVSPSGVHVAKIDLTKYPEVGEHHRVEGMPTVKMFHDGEVYDYDGKREHIAIIDFIRRVTSPPVGNITDLPALKSVEKGNEVFFVLSYTTGRSSELKTRYLKAASKLRLRGSFFDTVSKPVQDKLGVKKVPSLTVYRDGQVLTYDSKNNSQAAIEEWLSMERFSLCPHLDDYGIYDYVDTQRPVVFLLMAHLRSSLEQKMADHVRFIAYGHQYNRDFYFATTGQTAVVRRMLLKRVTNPCLVVWDFRSKHFWIYPSDTYEGVTQTDVENFLDSIKRGDIPGSGGESFSRRFYRMLWLMGETIMDVYETSPYVVLTCGAVLMFSLFFCVYMMATGDPEKEAEHMARIYERNRLAGETPGGFYRGERTGDESEEEEDEGEDDDSKAAKAKGKLKQS